MLQSLRRHILANRAFHTVVRTIVRVKWKLRFATRMKLLYLKLRMEKLNKRRREVKKKVSKVARNAILPSLPGVARLKLPALCAQHLLTTNDPPADEDIPTLRKIVAEANHEKERIKRKLFLRRITGQSSRLWEVATVHNIGRASRFIGQYEGVLSPLRRLPSEILQEIFLWTTANRVHSRWSSSRDVIPWNLGQVCRSWRASALAVSTLWAHFPSLSLKTASKVKTQRQLSLLHELLARSGSVGLDLYVHVTARFTESTHPVTELLMQHSDRWQVVTLELAHNLLSSFQPIRGRLALLKVLSLKFRPTESDSIIDAFEIAPRLTSVYVSGMHSGKLLLPFDQISSYKERLMSRELILNNILSSPTSLENLSILELSDGPAMSPVTLPRLVRLILKYYHSLGTPFLNNFTLPSIEEIKVISYRGRLLDSITTMLLNHREGASKLKSLSYRSDGEEPGTLSNLMKLTPNLVYLDASLPFRRDIINLATGYGHQQLIPLLETCKFHVDHSRFMVQEAHSLNDLAAARCELEAASVRDVGDSAVLLLPGDVRPLKTLLIYYDMSDRSKDLGALLNEYSVSPAFTSLRHLQNQLRDEFPELESREKPKSRNLDFQWKDRVNEILRMLEEVDVDVKDLFYSEIHLTLKKMCESKTFVKEKFGESATRILDKWEPLFKAGVKDRKWPFRGRHCAVYLSRTDPIRQTNQYLDIAYGLPQMAFSEIFWPMYISYELDRY